MITSRHFFFSFLVLSTCPHNKEALVESGGFALLVQGLDTEDQKLRTNYLTTIRNLSDAEADFVSIILCADLLMISYSI